MIVRSYILSAEADDLTVSVRACLAVPQGKVNLLLPGKEKPLWQQVAEATADTIPTTVKGEAGLPPLV